MVRGDKRIGQIVSEDVVQDLASREAVQTAGTDKIHDDEVEDPPYGHGNQELKRPFNVLFQIKGMMKQQGTVCHQKEGHHQCEGTQLDQVGRYAVSLGVGEMTIHNQKDGQHFQYIDISDPLPCGTGSCLRQAASPLS